jgi:hypothetical protein
MVSDDRRGHPMGAPATSSRPPQPSLVDRLGGPAALGAAVEQAGLRASADPDLGPTALELVLSTAPGDRLDFLVEAIEHRGGRSRLGLDAGDADRLAGHLADALSVLGVSPALSGEVRTRVVAALADSPDGPGGDVALRGAC